MRFRNLYNICVSKLRVLARIWSSLLLTILLFLRYPSGVSAMHPPLPNLNNIKPTLKINGLNLHNLLKPLILWPQVTRKLICAYNQAEDENDREGYGR